MRGRWAVLAERRLLFFSSEETDVSRERIVMKDIQGKDRREKEGCWSVREN
jgi:hypothetical protein